MSIQMRGLAKLAIACLALGALPALAEKADREKPMQIEADRVSLDDLNKVSVFEGNVVLTQGTLLVRADNAAASHFYEQLGYRDTKSICFQKIIGD